MREALFPLGLATMFDPYHKWLGIAPKDQPPNHYRLLAVDVFESDPEVIDAAANRQMAYLQQRATGEHAVLSQKLLNEIAAARLCLLNPEKKSEYDSRLRQSLSGGRHRDDKPAADTWLNEVLDAPPATASTIPVSPVRARWTRRLEIWHLAVLIGVLGLLSVAILAFVTSGGSDQQAVDTSVEPSARQEETAVTTLASDRSMPAQEEAEAATSQPIPDTSRATGSENAPTPGSRLRADSQSINLTGSAAPPKAKSVPQWSDIFDGQTLDDWLGTYNRDYWSVTGDALVGNGQGISLIQRPETFDDFELHTEAKINSGGRAGVLFRAADGRENDDWEPHGYKVWIVGSEVGVRERTGSLAGLADSRKSLAGLAEFTRNIVADDQWFSLDIVAKGSRIVVKVDEQTVVDFLDAQARYRSGKIAIQVWGTKNGTSVAFKNLRVKPLEAYSVLPQ